MSFRDDFVTTKSDDDNYPVFKNGICYIDNSGETVIEPRFLNATNFINKTAIALELKKRKLVKTLP